MMHTANTRTHSINARRSLRSLPLCHFFCLPWRAYVTGPFTQPDEKTIRKAVAAALEQFPPKLKS